MPNFLHNSPRTVLTVLLENKLPGNFITLLEIPLVAQGQVSSISSPRMHRFLLLYSVLCTFLLVQSKTGDARFPQQHAQGCSSLLLLSTLYSSKSQGKNTRLHLQRYIRKNCCSLRPLMIFVALHLKMMIKAIKLSRMKTDGELNGASEGFPAFGLQL